MTLLDADVYTEHRKAQKRFFEEVKDRKADEFKYIAKGTLQVDIPHYQRPTSEAKSGEISRKWSWLACGALVVALRPRTGYWAIDGGHRVMGAMKRSDIQDLPCLIWRMNDIVAEAEGFKKINTHRRFVGIADLFNAQVTSENPHALIIEELLESIGRTHTPGQTGVSCLSVLYMQLKTGREADLRRIWPLLHALHGNSTITEHMTAALCYIENHLKDGQSLMEPRWKNRILGLGMAELMVASQKASQFWGKGSAKVHANGILMRLNKQMKTQLVLREA